MTEQELRYMSNENLLSKFEFIRIARDFESGQPDGRFQEFQDDLCKMKKEILVRLAFYETIYRNPCKCMQPIICDQNGKEKGDEEKS